MREHTNRARWVLIGAIIGITAALLTVISDLILLGRPANAQSFWVNGTKAMVGLAQWRITAGVFLGVVALPFQTLGLISVYHGLKPAGKFLSFTAVGSAAHGLVMGAVFHVSYAFINSGWNVYLRTGNANIYTSEMMNKFNFYWKIIIFIVITELFISSICYAYAITRKNSLYPKWMTLFNPVCVYLFMYPVVFVLPAPVGGYVAPAYLNLSTAVFMTISMAVIYRKLKAESI